MILRAGKTYKLILCEQQDLYQFVSVWRLQWLKLKISLRFNPCFNSGRKRFVFRSETRFLVLQGKYWSIRFTTFHVTNVRRDEDSLTTFKVSMRHKSRDFLSSILFLSVNYVVPKYPGNIIAGRDAVYRWPQVTYILNLFFYLICLFALFNNTRSKLIQHQI
jgi:hypothetical protein